MAVELWEKIYLVDATTDETARNTLVSVSVAGALTEPTFAFGAGAAQEINPYCAEVYNNVLFIAGYGSEDASDDDRPEMIRHSYLGRSPDAANGFDKDAWNMIGAAGQRVTAMCTGRTIMLVAKANELYRVSGSGRAYPGWQYAVEQVENTRGLGVSNPLALAYAKGYWYGIGAGGPFRTDGFATDPLEGPRQRDWKGINLIANSWVRYNPERGLMLFGLHPSTSRTSRSATYPWIIWTWDIDRNVWQPNWDPDTDFFYGTSITTTTAQGPSAPPSSPNTTNLTVSTFTANWTNGDATAPTEYWEKKGASGTWLLIDTVAAGVATKARTGKTNYTLYYWKVRHNKNGVSSAFTADTEVKTPMDTPGISATGSGPVTVTMTQKANGSTLRLERETYLVGDWALVWTQGPVPAGDMVQYDSPDAGTYRYRVRSEDSGWTPTETAWALSGSVTVTEE
jgi:hypothetical protein